MNGALGSNPASVAILVHDDVTSLRYALVASHLNTRVPAPEVFDQDDDTGIVVLLDDHPGSNQTDNVRNAAEFCPAQVISIQD